MDYPSAGMLHAALARSPHAHAAVLGIDATELPRDVSILTAADLPGQLCTGPIRADRPVLAAGVVRHRGEPVAAVLAPSAEAARAAATSLPVAYRELRPVAWSDAEGADPIHPDGNVLRTVHVRRGAPPPAPGVVIEGSYNTHGWVPDPEPFGVDGRPPFPSWIDAVPPAGPGALLRLRGSRRWHPADREQVARCLDLTPDQILLEVAPGPTDFSTDLGGPVVAGALALRSGRPVRLHLDPPGVHGGGGGPLITLRYRHSADADGNLLAVSAEIEIDAGAYSGLAEALVAQVCAVAGGPYRVPAVDIRVTALRSTSPPPMVEPGAVAAAVAFAVEAQLDRLARYLDTDSRALRERHLLALDDPLPTGQLPLEDSPIVRLLAELDAAGPTVRLGAPAEGAEVAVGAGTGFGMVPFGAGEGADVPVQARVRLLAGTGTVLCAAAEGDEHLEAAAVAAARGALGVPVLFERTGEPVTGGSATSVGLAVASAVDSLTASARETLGWRTGMSPALLAAVDGRLRSFDGVVHVPLSELIPGKAEGSGWYSPGRSEPLGPNGQGDAFPGFAHAAARAVLRLTATGAAEVLRLDVAADCGRVLDLERARAAVETSVRTGLRLALPEATVAPDAVRVSLADGFAPKGAAGVAAGAVAAALRAAMDAAVGSDADVLPIPGVSWATRSARSPGGGPGDGGWAPFDAAAYDPAGSDPAAVPGRMPRASDGTS